ncbi:hypothetical protein BH10CHL1_BH10CHL1_03210 [soil metagenome]
MDVLHALSPVDWLRLVLALILYLGPGYALATCYREHRTFDKTMMTALAIPLALSFWTVSLAWLQNTDIRLAFPSAVIIAVLGWGVTLVQWRRTNFRFTMAQAQALPRVDGGRIILWLVLLAAVGLNLWALHGTVVAPGSDGYHHTLFAQMIAERGGLPQDLLPLTPVASFTYHFGFHGFVATITWLTDIALARLPVVALTPILGQILKAMAALCAAFFAERITQDRKAAPISAAVVGLIAVFPAYLVNWGRDTQLTGFVIAPVLLALLWQWAEKPYDWHSIPLLALLAAGVTLTHYRVTAMTVIGGILIILASGYVHKWSRPEWLQRGLRLIGFSIGLIVLVAPWFWHLYTVRKMGYAVNIGDQNDQVFSLTRLGDGVINYPTNLPLLTLLMLALLVGWWQRVRMVIVLSVWAGLLMVLSAPRLLGLYMDTVTVFTSFYFVGAVIIGWFGAMLLTGLAKQRFVWIRWVVIAGLSALALQGGLAITTIIDANSAYVKSEDLPAMAWIRQNTPASAYFMVNTFHFDFWPDYVIGSDAGFWLPVLAHRRTVTAPMTYPVERNITRDYGKQIAALDQLKGELTSPTAISLLQQQGVTYIYIGERGGSISAQALLDSPAFKLEFQNGAAYIFRFLGAP